RLQRSAGVLPSLSSMHSSGGCWDNSGNVLGYGQTGGGRRRGRVPYQDDVTVDVHREVVHQRAVPGHRLRPHPARGPAQVIGGELGHVTAGGRGEGALGERVVVLPVAGAAVAAGHAERAGPGENTVKITEISPVVPLVRARQDRVRPDQDLAVDPP